MNKTNSSFNIKSVRFKNRIGMPPMCQYSAVNGYANNWHYVHYGSRAIGGTGLIILEATAISPEGRITPYDLGLWHDEHIIELKKIAAFIHQSGAVAGIQIAHAGRKASHDKPSNGGKQLSAQNGGWETLAPSEIPFTTDEIPPIALSKEGIQNIIAQFKACAARAVEAGFKVLEIHAAHGYLIHEFLSPLSNNRTDEYGGSFKNRIRLLLEVTKEIRTVWPTDLPLFVRLSATDWTSGGVTIDETVALSKILKEIGVDLIDVSSGGNVPSAQIPIGPGYQVPLSEAIRSTGILTSAVGLINSTNQAIEIIENEKADLVLIGRELLRNPYFALQISDIEWPEQYLRAKL